MEDDMFPPWGVITAAGLVILIRPGPLAMGNPASILTEFPDATGPFILTSWLRF